MNVEVVHVDQVGLPWVTTEEPRVEGNVLIIPYRDAGQPHEERYDLTPVASGGDPVPLEVRYGFLIRAGAEGEVIRVYVARWAAPQPPEPHIPEGGDERGASDRT